MPFKPIDALGEVRSESRFRRERRDQVLEHLVTGANAVELDLEMSESLEVARSISLGRHASSRALCDARPPV